ncbi:MAG: VC0807 family protein [Spongiibacter sp.]|uniref:MFS transporter n=1 Tax=Spongiibacter thalassae TaxID=2721624 RepID=A0ABX1GFE4_9GAMM|nr:VC0807 family protein [Spongiibacter thalassae]MDX1506008.1 VC0807 family protein [Spongiibacter sp.]NKI17927.1 MFS transporter [Spongiibacter thalassae]
MPNGAKAESQHNVLTNLLFNIIIPTLILTKLSDVDSLGPRLSIVVALAFPLGFGMWDFVQTRRANFFSILGFVSVLLTGGISLLELDAKYIAIKEASIPALIGLATLISLYTPYPLIKTFLYNDKVMDVDKVAEALKARDAEQDFEQSLRNATYMLAFSFFLSSTLNYILAKVLLVSPPGTPEYSAELGKMTGLSFPVIALPCTLVMMGALFYLLNRIRKLTSLGLEDIFRLHEE